MINRRRLLQIAGGTVLAPWLPSLAGRGRAFGQSATPPKRIIFMYAPNGVPVGTWWPTTALGGFDLNEATMPLAPHKSDVLFMRGLHFAAQGPGGPHARGMGTALTGVSLQAGDMPSNDGRLAGWADGISLDQKLVQELSPNTPFPSLQVGVRGDNHLATNMSRLSYSAPAQAIPPISSPLTLWRTLFPGMDPNQPAPGGGVQTKVLDTVKAQFDRLSPRVSSEDRLRLESHLGHLEQLQDRIREMEGGTGSASCGDVAEPGIADVNGDGQPDEDHDKTMEGVAELQVDLLVAAITCGLTNIATYQYANAWDRVTFPWIGSSKTGHDLSHAGNSNTVDQGYWTDVARYHMTLMARMISGLKAVPEGDGSVFDSTAIVFFSEVAVGNTHTHENIPYVMAGSLGGMFETGRYLDFGGRYHNDLLVTLMNAMGVAGDTFGTPELNQGPLGAMYL